MGVLEDLGLGSDWEVAESDQTPDDSRRELLKTLGDDWYVDESAKPSRASPPPRETQKTPKQAQRQEPEPRPEEVSARSPKMHAAAGEAYDRMLKERDAAEESAPPRSLWQRTKDWFTGRRPAPASEQVESETPPPDAGDQEQRTATETEQQPMSSRVAEKTPGPITIPQGDVLAKAFDAMQNLGDRRKVLGILRSVPKERQQEFLQAAEVAAGELGKERSSFALRMAQGVARGISQGAQGIMELTGSGGTEEEIDAIRKLEGIAANTIEPAIPTDPWYTRAPVQAAQMAPAAVEMVAGGTAAKGAVKGLGLASKAAQTLGMGRKAVRAGEIAGIAAAAFPSQYAQEVQSLKEAGVTGPWQKPIAALTATAVGAIESIVPNPFKAGKVPLDKGAIAAAKQYLIGAAKQYPGELSEEYLQGLASGLGRTIATHLDENAPDQGLGSAFLESWNQGKEAMLPLAVMMGAPAAAGATAAGIQAKKRGFQKVAQPASTGLNEAVIDKMLAESAGEAGKPSSVATGPQEATGPRLVSERYNAEPGPLSAAVEDTTAAKENVPNEPIVKEPDRAIEVGETGEADAGRSPRVEAGQYAGTEQGGRGGVSESGRGDGGAVPDAETEAETEEAAVAKEPWQMTRDELAEAVNAKDRPSLEAARPLLGAMFPEYTAENDPWGIHRAVSRGDELPRVPMVDFTKRHREQVQKALDEGKSVPPEVLAEYPELQPKPAAPPAVEPEKRPPWGTKSEAAESQPTVPEGFWDHQPFAQSVAAKSLGSKALDPAVRDNVADAALAKALTTYDPAKAGDMSLENWIRRTVRQEVGRAAKQQAESPERSLGEDAAKVQAPAAETPVDEPVQAAEQRVVQQNADLEGMGVPQLRKVLSSLGAKPRALKKGALLEEIVRLRSQQTEQPPAPKRKLGQPATAGSPSLRVGAQPNRSRKPIGRGVVAATFPGARITPAESGWHVEVGDSFVTIQMTDEIPVDWDAVEQHAGRKIPAAMRTKIRAAGSFSMTLPDGTQHRGLGLIQLAEGMADDAVLRHEALHLARSAGIITDAEWSALVDAHAKDVDPTNTRQQEERIAMARETRQKIGGVWGKIRSWLRRLIAKLGISRLEARDVHQMMQEPAFWGRVKPGTQGTGPSYALRGRPDLANPATDQDARRLVDTVDEARNAGGRPDVRHDTDVVAEADRRLDADWSGERDGLLTKGRSGAQLDDVETVMAKKIVNQETSTALRSGDAAAIADVMALIEAYRNTGTEQARAFRQRRDPVESPAERMARAISEALFTPPEKTRNARAKARQSGDTAAADKINNDEAERYHALRGRLKELGVDIDDLVDGKYSRTKAAKALRAIRHVKADVYDKMYEWWNNSILSAATTQTANLSGNAGHGTWRLTADRLVEAMANLVLGRSEDAQFGEFKYMMAGVLPGLSRASQNFMMTWRTEFPTLEWQLGRQGKQTIEELPGAIGGTFGRVVRMPWRLLGAADDFAKSLITEIEVGSRAYRIANAEGLSGDAMQARIAELHADLESTAWDMAYDSALESAFQQHGEGLSSAVKKHALGLRKDVRGVRYLIPFVNTPANIMATGIKRLPLIADIRVARQMLKNYRANKPVFEGVPAKVAQQVLAWGVVLALLSNDPDDPWITGAEPAMTPASREESYRTRPAMSVKIDGTWRSYSRIEPFATVLGLTVDAINAMRSGNAERIVKVPFASMVGQLTNKTFLSGLGDFYEALTSGDTAPDKLAKWGSNFTSSWVPNIIRSPSRESGEAYPQRKVWGRGADRWARLGRRTLQKTEFPVSPITGPEYPIYDVWGKPAVRSESPTMTDWMWRILVPIKEQKAEMFVADRLIVNYNNQNPDEAVFPHAPEPTYTINGKTRYMTDAQYAEFCKRAGEAAVRAIEKRVNGRTLDPDHPTKQMVDWINKVTTDTRHDVMELLKRRWAVESGEPLRRRRRR